MKKMRKNYMSSKANSGEMRSRMTSMADSSSSSDLALDVIDLINFDC